MDDRTLTGSPADRFPPAWLYALSVRFLPGSPFGSFFGAAGGPACPARLLTQAMVFIWRLLPRRACGLSDRN